LAARPARPTLQAFCAKIDVLRERTEGLNLRDHRDAGAGATAACSTHYRAEREGADRVENLEELVNAAESFVTQEGFGRDA